VISAKPLAYQSPRRFKNGSFGDGKND